MEAARALTKSAVDLGDSVFATEWPTSIVEPVRAVRPGGALSAYEIGGDVLQSRDHPGLALWAATFQLYVVTFGPTSSFRLTPHAVTALQCPLKGVGRTIARAEGFRLS